MSEIYFKLASNENQYQEFNVGLTTLKVVFTYNNFNNRYYLTFYKNFDVVVKSIKLVVTQNNLLASYYYKDIGYFSAVVEDYEFDTNGKKVYKEITKDNLTDVIFRWQYE